ncbi:MAG: acetyl-CoA acetyltransferase [Gammaproteobacteria bacterium]
MAGRNIRGQVAIVGIGESTYYKRGQSPDSEFKLCIDAIRHACRDAGIDPRTIDGFSSYSDDRNDAMRISNALNMHELNYSVMQWGGGGGGVMAAVANGAAGIAAGYCDRVVVHRALAQGQFGRFGQAQEMPVAPGEYGHVMPYGVMSAAQLFVFRITRYMHEHQVGQEALRAIAMASYHHAQNNPRAVMQGKPLTEQKYDESRYITEPLHLFDCCQENDGAAALVLMSAEEAADITDRPVYLLGAAMGSAPQQGAESGGISYHNAPDFATSNFKTLAPKAYARAGITPADIDLVQSYENFTGGVLMAMIEHGLCQPEEANEFFVPENLIVGGRMPLNTSGGNLAECYMHGLELVVEGTRQLRGESVNQVENARHCLCIGGPMVGPASTLILGSDRGE